MSVLVTLSLLSLCFVGISAQNDEFNVTEPKAGDTVTISKYTTDGVVVPIKWTVPSALADKPVIISLVQGNDLSSLSTISQINGVSFLSRYRAEPFMSVYNLLRTSENSERTKHRLIYMARRRVRQRARLRLRLWRAFGM